MRIGGDVMKRWHKPMILTLTAKELKVQIKAAARSWGCTAGHSR